MSPARAVIPDLTALTATVTAEMATGLAQ